MNQAPKGPKKRPTLRDVATAAGVSVQTASHVLAGTKTARVSEQTRERVHEAAKALRYEPNRSAQAIRSGKSYLIALWMPIDRQVLAYLKILNELSTCAKGSQYDLVIFGLTLEDALGANPKPPRMCPVDGVISADSGKAIEKFRSEAMNDNIAVSILGYETARNGDSVTWRLMESSADVIELMLQRNRRKVVHLTPRFIYDSYPNERRRRGYTETMEKHGLDPILIPVDGELPGAAEQAMSLYLQDHETPDGVFCFSDPLAIGAARALHASGAEIPQACEVWGVGNYPEAEEFFVPISTLRTPYEKIVPQAFDWIVERIEDPTIEPRYMEFPLDIVDRTGF